METRRHKCARTILRVKMAKYFDELKRAMEWLGTKQDTFFMGQAVVADGTAMSNTLKQVPLEKSSLHNAEFLHPEHK